MPDVANPLIPSAYDVVWGAAAVIVVALSVIALISIARTAKNLTTTMSLIWTLLTIFIPVLGALAWLFIGRPASRPDRQHRPETAS